MSQSDIDLRSVEDVFIASLIEKGYQVATRSDVEQVMKEIQFQQSGLTEDGAANIGRMLNASAVLIVTLNSVNVTSKDSLLIVNGSRLRRHTAQAEIGARLIGVEKAEILGIGSISASADIDDPQNPAPAILKAAKGLADALPPKQRS